MIKQADIEKLQRFRRRLSNKDEEQFVYSLFSENENNKGFEQHILNDFIALFSTSSCENHNSAYLLDRIHHIIHKRENYKKQTAIKRISGNRQVSITGEAWSDVARDDLHYFEIKAGESKVKVMGTKLNICPMAEVARRIERWYNVDVVSMTSPIRFRILERKVLADRTWERGKVMVYHITI